MRITGGIFKGHRIRTVRDRALRPSTDKLRQAVFNIIGSGRIQSAKVLDLFAGTGAFGIEALSRGASFVLYVDRDRRMCNTIKETIMELGFLTSTGILCMDAFRALVKLKRDGECFSVIFADPPYRKNIVKKLIELIDRSTILKDDGIVIVEHSKDELPGEEYTYLIRRTFKKYGDFCVSIYERK